MCVLKKCLDKGHLDVGFLTGSRIYSVVKMVLWMRRSYPFKNAIVGNIEKMLSVTRIEIGGSFLLEPLMKFLLPCSFSVAKLTNKKPIQTVLAEHPKDLNSSSADRRFFRYFQTNHFHSYPLQS